MAVLFCRCGDGNAKSSKGVEKFKIEHFNGMTPVKDQGDGSVCWAYAMLAAIETTHISQGDSVNLSPAWAVRALMEDCYHRNVLTQGSDKGSDRATGMTLINIIQKYGIVPYDSYPDHDGMGVSTSVLLNKTGVIAGKAVNAAKGIQKYQTSLDGMLDDALGHTPKNVYMLSAQYTPVEFAHSVCRPDEYVALTSFSHHPFGEWFALEIADNWERNLFYNMPIDTLMKTIEMAIRIGDGVCWEGDITEDGFDFDKGTATIDIPKNVDVQTMRQKEFEAYKTTDDHCMAIVGIARSSSGEKYFIMKNSWGTDNPYGGLMYVSEDYVRLKTVAVFLPLPTNLYSCPNVPNKSQQ